MIVKLTMFDKEQLYSLKKVIDKDFKTDFTISFLESKFRMNDYKLRHGFKQLFGMTITEYHTRRRMEHALVLLEEDDLTIQEIITKTGYNKKSTFYRAFSRNFAMTPKEWRKRNKNIIVN